MSKTNKIVLAVIAIIVIILIVIFSNQSKSKEEGVIKIGISTLLSGDFSGLGENIVNTAKIAIDKINNTGGINGKKLELQVEDALVSSKDGLTSAQKLINVDNIKYIIGGTSANGTLAVAPLVNEKKVVYITPVTGGKNIDEAGEYIFRLANSDLLAGRDIARAMLKLNYKKVVSVVENTEYTIGLKNSFEEEIKSKGELVFSEVFQPNENDFKTLLTKIKEKKPEAILLGSQTGLSGAYFVKQMREMNLNIPIFSDFTFVANENSKKMLGSLDGIYFADPAYDEIKSQELFKEYESIYKKAPFIPFHSAATYDSIMILAQALKTVGDDSQKIHDYLITNVKNYNGLMGTFSLDQNGNSDLGFAIKKMVDGKVEVLR